MSCTVTKPYKVTVDTVLRSDILTLRPKAAVNEQWILDKITQKYKLYNSSNQDKYLRSVC